ncbi:MAG: MFS transporter [bacterium]|nr:MFS transporter [bacterium]
MSVVVVVKKKDKTVIASDSLSSQGSIVISSKFRKKEKKIIRIADSYMGFVGSSAVINIFDSIKKYHSDLLCFDSKEDVFETLRRLHPVLKDEYYLITEEDDEEQPYESSQLDALVANKHGIFEIQSYREIMEYSGFWSIGSGRRFALGAMHALYDSCDDALEIAKAGVAAACEFDESCGLPINHHIIK